MKFVKINLANHDTCIVNLDLVTSITFDNEFNYCSIITVGNQKSAVTPEEVERIMGLVDNQMILG